MFITTFNNAFQYLGYLIEDYYEKEQCFDCFILIDEEPLLLQYISLIEITKEFDKVALISVTADDIMHFACFKKYIIVNLFFYAKLIETFMLIS